MSPPATIHVGAIEYTRHPLSALFGNLSDDDYLRLKRSIAHVGQQRPVLLAAGDGHVVLDGWNRLRVLAELNREPLTQVAAHDADEVQLVTAVNLAQRTLTAGQRALIAARLASYTHGGARTGAGRVNALASEAQHSDRSAAKSGSALDETADDDLPGIAASPKNQRLNLASDSLGDDAPNDHAGFAVNANTVPSPISLAEAADRLGISRAYAARARSVSKKAIPGVLAAVQRGEMSLNQAAGMASQPIETQTQYMLRRIKEGTAARRLAAKANLDRDRQFDRHVRKHGVPPDDATRAEVAAYITAILATTGTTAAQLGNWIEDGKADPKQSSFEQFFMAVDRLRERRLKVLPR